MGQEGRKTSYSIVLKFSKITPRNAQPPHQLGPSTRLCYTPVESQPQQDHEDETNLDVQVAVEQASEMPLDLEKCKTAFGLFDDVPLDSES